MVYGPQPTGRGSPLPSVGIMLAIRRVVDGTIDLRPSIISILRFSSLNHRGEVNPTVVIFETRG